MEMYRSTRIRNKTSSNMRMKASSLYFLNDISNIDSVDGSTNSDNWRDTYTFNPMIIGRGHFSKVYKVKCCSTGNNAAIKIIRRRRLGTDRIDEIMQEIEIMQLLNKSSNTAFIQLLKVHTSPIEVAIVMEFASGGSLFHVTQDSRTGLSEVYVKIVLAKILSALSVIHRHDIVHLDIKADNILLRHPYQSTDVVLIDFGLAKKLTKSKVHKEMIGTPDYIAPEVLNYEQICLKSDMWSMGVLTYFLLTNVSPFSGDSKEDTLNKVTKTQFEFVGHLKEENMHLARNFINSLLVRVPENRLSADDCMSHDFLANVPIMECPSDRAPCPEVPIINLDYNKVHVRQNTTYKTRGMVMSQYDICSSDINDTSGHSMENLLRGHSDNCLDSVQACDKVDHESVEVGLSLDSTEAVLQDHNNDCLDNVQVCDKVDHEFVDAGLSLDSIEVVLQDHSDDCLDSAQVCDKVDHGSVDINLSLGSIEQLEDDETRCDDSIVKKERDKMPIDMIIYHMMEFSDDNIDKDIHNDEQKGPDLTIIDSGMVCALRSSTDAIDNDFDEMGTSIFERPNPDEDTMVDCYCSENPQSHDMNKSLLFAPTKIRESRRRLMPQTHSDSFRNSRENIIDVNNNNENRVECDVTHKNTVDMTQSQSGTIDSRHVGNPRSPNGVMKRIHMSKSLKRDFDKPNIAFDKWSRHSQIETESYDNFDIYSGNDIHGVTKSNPALLQMTSDQKRHSLSRSAHLSTVPGNELKRTPSKLQRLIKNLKPKTSEKKSHCTIS